MATVKFRLKSNSKKEQNTIYVYLSNGRGNMFEVKSGFSIEPQDWQVKLGFPKQNNPINKNIHSDLKLLESFIHDSLNTANSKGELIDKFWLERKIKECFNRVDKKDSEVLVNHINHIIDNAHTRKVKGKKGLGLSESRIKGYKTFLNKIEKYQLKIGRTIRLTEISSPFVSDFTTWLIETKGWSMNYAGKQIDNLKAVCTDAERLDIAVHPYAKNIQSFSESSEDRNIVTLSFEEQQKIADTPMPSESLENIKKWILIACTFGQRGEDLLKFSVKNCRKEKDYFFIDVWQEKLSKWVTVPIMSESISDIIMNHKPYRVSLQKLNDYVKIVCKIAGIDTLTEGGIIKVSTVIEDKVERKIKRKVKGIYPKWELITTHSFRRSFATNYYKKIATPVLMGITGHTRESTFLIYINKQLDKDDNARLFAMQWKQMMQSNL
jgi:integrase